MHHQPTTPRREIQLRGSRPAPLRINEHSHQIIKPPSEPHAPPQVVYNQPLIIYSVSPKPIHVDPSNFMSIVQKLTGKDSNFTSPSSSSPASDAPPSSVTERTSPTEKETREKYRGDLGEEINVEVGPLQGILSEAPVNLPEITPDMFPPVNDGFGPSPSTKLFDVSNENVGSPADDFFNLSDFS